MSNDYKTLSQDLAVKSLMGEFNAANGYGLIGNSAEQTANLENIDPKTGEKRKAKDVALMLFLDEMQRLDQEARELMDKLDKLQNDMNDILGEMETDIGDAKDQEAGIKDLIKAYADKDVDKMTEFMMASGLFDEAEINAMKENGSFARAYEEFVDDNISALSSTMEKIAGHSIKYNEIRNAIEDVMKDLTEKQDLTRAAGITALVEEIDQSLEEQQNLLNANEVRYEEVIQGMADFEGVDALREALEEHSKNNRHDAAFSELSLGVLQEEIKNEIQKDESLKIDEADILKSNPNIGSGFDFN